MPDGSRHSCQKRRKERSGLTIIRPLVYFREQEIIENANKLGLQPLKNPCPYNGNTKRQEIKEMLSSLEAKDPEYYRRFPLRCAAAKLPNSGRRNRTAMH